MARSNKCIVKYVFIDTKPSETKRNSIWLALLDIKPKVSSKSSQNSLISTLAS